MNPKVDNEYIVEELKLAFNDDILLMDESYGMLGLEIKPSKINDLLKWFKEHPVIKANFLTDICGAHFPDLKDRELAVIYHVQSMENNIRVRIKCFIPISSPKIASATNLYVGANWMERETFDFYGVEFEGHPNLQRILNVDEMDYFPLRKQYPLEDGTREDKDDSYFGR
ncbi:MAG: NADH-quinone oxidoreductase subunit C [Cyclobacteriaceae bacterium]|nr:NADH-quinone oxidoreductase subunit C [Cyclobacteriaceae bacterium]MCH8515253.1 NADH-quinone oxidoreductase subunit C [Cyclobacteriaceae bacterium]